MLDWIDPESWQAFIDMRKKIKAPLTPYAEKLIMRELVKLKTSGQDPQACLDQSIMNSWRDVFPLRDKGLSVAPTHQTWQAPPPMSAQERAANAEAARKALSAIKRVSA